MVRRTCRGGPAQGQTMVETALVLPLFLMVIVGIIVIGIGLFYQQQVTNAAREAARYAAIHSATADCPTSSWLAPNPELIPVLPAGSGLQRGGCGDDPTTPTQWTNMQAHGRAFAGFGFAPDALHFAACWSGYIDEELEAAGEEAWDGPPFRTDGPDPDPDPDGNRWEDCTIAGTDPIANPGAVSCPPPRTVPSDDKASNLAVSSVVGTANQVTVFACYEWQPPLAGFLLIPQSISLGATVSETLQHQR